MFLRRLVDGFFEITEETGQQLAQWVNMGSDEDTQQAENIDPRPLLPPVVKDKKPLPEGDDICFDHADDLKPFFEELGIDFVDDYLRSIGWISNTQTWVDLTSDKVSNVKDKKQGFEGAIKNFKENLATK